MLTASTALCWLVPPSFNYPLFVADLEGAFRDCPHRYEVYEGYRTLDEQSGRWATYRRGQGPIAQPPGKSPHNYGCAVHLRPVTGETDHRAPIWTWISGHFPTNGVGRSRIVHGRARNRWEHLEWRRWTSWMR